MFKFIDRQGNIHESRYEIPAELISEDWTIFNVKENKPETNQKEQSSAKLPETVPSEFNTKLQRDNEVSVITPRRPLTQVR